jgi:ligand-binding SRPBCC domain-containing protein
MALIHLTTFITAPVERVFDLTRSINLHRISNAHTGEKAIAGITNGLINEGETVTWQAKHLFKLRSFTSKITTMRRPDFFVDEMIQGDFTSFKHEHHFKSVENGTIMIDKVEFETPYAVAGKLFNKLYLTNYMKELLVKRNSVIKEYSETQKWRAIMN